MTDPATDAKPPVAPKPAIVASAERGEIGGRTAQIERTGAVSCVEFPLPAVPSGAVLIRTVRSAISPGTEMTFYGKGASNPYLSKAWDAQLRLFQPGAALPLPMSFGYRAAGQVVESRVPHVRVGDRIYGNWSHTEYTVMDAARAVAQRLPDEMSWDDGVDFGQMAPICANAVAYGEGEQAGRPAVVFGAGPVGLLTAQFVRAAGASSVYVVDRLASRIAIAEGLGFATVDALSVDVAVTIKSIHGSEGVPVAWECTGSAAALNEAIRVVRRRGTVVAVSFYQGDAIGLHLGDEFHHNGIRIQCGQIGNLHPSVTLASLRAKSLALAAEGGVVFGGLPRSTMSIDDIALGFDALTHPDEVLQVALSYEPAPT